MAYFSEDLRIAAVKFNLKGNTSPQTAEVFGCGTTSISTWKREFLKSKEIKDKVRNREKTRKVTLDKVNELLEKNPDSDQNDMAKAFGCTQQSVSAALKKFKITLKKN